MYAYFNHVYFIYMRVYQNIVKYKLGGDSVPDIDVCSCASNPLL